MMGVNIGLFSHGLQPASLAVLGACRTVPAKEEQSMVKIYGAHRSRASRNYWLAGEMGLSVEEVPVLPAHRVKDPSAADAPLNTHSAAYRTIVPIGAVPAMDDDGFVLTESLAINLYLARKFGGALGPRDAQEDAQMQQWALFAATWVEPFALDVMRGEDVETAAESLRRPLAVLESRFRTEEYMVGNRFTVADINMAEVLRYTQSHPALLGEYPAVDTWLKACQARPAFRKMWARRMAEPD